MRVSWHSTRAALALGLLLTCELTFAQQPVIPDKFSARAELVLIPAVVTDKSGAHITGLKAEDFLVRENGKERALTLFEEVVTTPGQWSAVPRSESGFSNLVFTPSKPSRLSIVVVDMLNTPQLDMEYARQALLRFATQSAAAREPVAIVALSRTGVRLLHGFTTDPIALSTALQMIRAQNLTNADTTEELEGTLRAFETMLTVPNPSADWRKALSEIRLTAEFQQDFVDFQRRVAVVQTLQGLQQIAAMFVRIPGRKSLIWATASFPMSLGDSTSQITQWFSRQGLKDLLPGYERTWKLLNDANISVYPVDVRGLHINSPSPSGAYPLTVPDLAPPGNVAAHIPTREGVWEERGIRFDTRPGTDSPVSTDSPLALSIPGSAAPNVMKGTRDRIDAVEADTIATMQTFAEMTGGRAFYRRNDLERCFQQATDDSARYYILGYYLEKNAKPGWHKLDVKLRRAAGEVRARNGFYTGEDEYRLIARRGEDFRLALRSPLDYTELGLAVEIVELTSIGEKRQVKFRISMTPSPRVVDFTNRNHVALEYYAAATRPDGTTAAETDHRVEGLLKDETAEGIATGGLHHYATLELPPGEYVLRVVVRDNLHGLLGSTSGPITVR